MKPISQFTTLTFDNLKTLQYYNFEQLRLLFTLPSVVCLQIGKSSLDSFGEQVQYGVLSAFNF